MPLLDSHLSGTTAALTRALATLTFGLVVPGIAWANDRLPEQGPVVLPTAAPLASPQPVTLPKPQRFNIYVQSTNTQQYHGAFPAAYTGSMSITPLADTAKTVDATVFLGARVGAGTELYLNFEGDQGFGLGTPPNAPGQSYAGTFGAAGFPSAESYKVGSDRSYTRMQRLFARQAFDLGGGDRQPIDPDINQLGGSIAPNNVVVTAGKFSAADVFDTNPYAHDPKNDFLNWSVIDMGAFDYPGDAWGYSVGASAELSEGNSTLRAGMFQLSAAPGALGIDPVPFDQYSSMIEFEQRTSFFGGRAGAFKGLIFDDTGYMGSYADALALAQQTSTAPATASVRTKHQKIGGGFNVAQEVAPHVGVFARVSAMNGSYEAYDFTDIDRSLSGGVSINGALFRRPFDAIGAAFALNGLSLPAQHYFAAGGTGLLLGDGALSYGTERILETYYRLGISRMLGVTFDYQFIQNPGYNTVRGPISVFGVRYHAQL